MMLKIAGYLLFLLLAPGQVDDLSASATAPPSGNAAAAEDDAYLPVPWQGRVGRWRSPSVPPPAVSPLSSVDSPLTPRAAAAPAAQLRAVLSGCRLLYVLMSLLR